MAEYTELSMPLNLSFVERLLLFRLNRGPAPVLDLFGAASFEAASLAIDLGVFTELTREEQSPAKLAERVDADPDGLRMLLRFLDAERYVTERDGRYRTTSTTDRWLTDAGTNLAPWFTYWEELVFPFFEESMETAVREGSPPETIYDWLGEDEEKWTIAQGGFRAAARVLAEPVADAMEVPDDARTLLDVGGGHGQYSVELARTYPNLTPTVYDNQAALDFTREVIADAGLESRVSVASGDYTTDDLGDGYDVATLFNVIHAHDAAENVTLFERVRDALAPGGRIAVLDQFAESSRLSVGNAGIGFVGLTYLVTLGQTLPEFEELEQWLREAGFIDVTRTSIRAASPGNTLVQARIPEA